MSNEVKLNIDSPNDCLKILETCLDSANTKGVFKLNEAFIVSLALKNLKKFVDDNKVQE